VNIALLVILYMSCCISNLPVLVRLTHRMCLHLNSVFYLLSWRFTRTVFSHRQSGTRCHIQLWAVTPCLF